MGQSCDPKRAELRNCNLDWSYRARNEGDTTRVVFAIGKKRGKVRERHLVARLGGALDRRARTVRQGRKETMELILQIALVAAMIAYLWQRHVDLNQRNRESSEDLLVKVKAELGTQNLNDGASWLSLQAMEGGQGATRNWRDLWKLYRRAGLLMRMADHADREPGDGFKTLDPAVILTLRRNAMQVRLSALTGIAGCAFQR